MEIRRLVISDVEKLVEMVKSFRGDTSNPIVAERFLQNDSNFIVAAIDGECVIGFVLGYQLQRYDGQNDMMYIYELGVLEEYRQIGIGKKMINYMIQICKGNKISKIFLITNKSNEPAVCLYKSTGAKTSHDDDIVYWYNDFNSTSEKY